MFYGKWRKLFIEHKSHREADNQFSGVRSKDGPYSPPPTRWKPRLIVCSPVWKLNRYIDTGISSRRDSDLAGERSNRDALDAKLRSDDVEAVLNFSAKRLLNKSAFSPQVSAGSIYESDLSRRKHDVTISSTRARPSSSFAPRRLT